jgi:hypothetical protein
LTTALHHVSASQHLTAGLVADPQRPVALLGHGSVDETPGDVDGGHLCAALGEEARVAALAAAQVEAAAAGQVGEHGHKRRRVDQVAVDVVAGPGQLGPGVGVLVPIATNLSVIHDPHSNNRQWRRGVASGPPGREP